LRLIIVDMARQSNRLNRDAGILVLRLGFGIMFMFHGFPAIMGGTEEWEKTGAEMQQFGINFLPVFWGFMAAFAEFGGGILLILGLFTRISSALLFITLVVASVSHLSKDPTLLAAAHPIEDAIVFLSLIIIGPGRYSLDAMISG